MKTKSLRSGKLYFGAERLVFSHKEVGTHYIWSGFDMELYLAKVYPETIMIMGQWKISTFLRYIRRCRGATASGRSRDARARKAARAWKLQDRTCAQINKRARKEKYKKPLK